jgi:hypothetical protein
MQDTMPKFFDEIARNFSEFNLPFSQAYALCLRQFLELQMLYLKWYQNNVQVHAHDSTLEDSINGMVRNLMASHIEFLRLERQNREKFLKMQSEMINNYLEALGSMLKTTREQQG